MRTFSKLNNIKMHSAILVRASWDLLGQANIYYNLPDRQVAKKVNFDHCYIYIPQSVISAKYQMKLDKWNSKDLLSSKYTLEFIQYMQHIASIANQL